MWQKAVKEHVDAGEMVAIGVVQEQHPDRTLLYRQWRELDWPIAVDSLGTLEYVKAVPIPMGIDEMGIVQYARFQPRQLDEFLKTEYEKLDIPDDYNRAEIPAIEKLRALAEERNTAEAWRELGEATFNFGSADELSLAAAALEKSIELDPGRGQGHFALGAVLRRRYESSHRHAGDQQAAIAQWGAAMEINPNQYIWRRRIQQYGPRLNKPYNFYFWIAQARKEITARGEEPLALTIEPMGSEIAARSGGDDESALQPVRNLDPEGRIDRDSKNLIGIETMVTPAKVKPGKMVRVRVTFRPNEKTHPLWNNEVDDLLMWVGVEGDLELGERHLSFLNPEQPETHEIRQLEFELAIDAAAGKQSVRLPAYALYYVCEDEGGVCYYLRHDFEVAFEIDPEAVLIRR